MSSPNPISLRILTKEQRVSFLSRIDEGRPDECWEWTGYTHFGYGRWHIGLRRDGSRRCVQAHRLAWHLAHPGKRIPPGKLVCHRCDVRLCCNPRHLFIATHLGNMRDMAEKGRAKGYVAGARRCRGESHPRAVLSDAQVRTIRKRIDLGHAAMARMIGVTTELAYQLRKGLSRKEAGECRPLSDYQGSRGLRA